MLPKVNLKITLFVLFLPLGQGVSGKELNPEVGIVSETTDVVKLSGRFLYAVKVEDSAKPYFDTLANLEEEYFFSQIENINRRKAFWINIYNAVTQYHLKKNPELYTDRSKFYKMELVNIAGHNLSLDNVEHGMLRRSKSKWSKGYFNTLFKSNFEKYARMDKVDYRIHFALNCGASSCPPIAFYNADKLDKQLDMTTQVYLNGESEIKDGAIYVPKLMTWFKADFGGKKGIWEKLIQWGIVTRKQKQNLKLKFKEYNWDIQLNYYKNL